MKKIHIVTGSIRAGKTTFLKKYIQGLKSVTGILQPTVGNIRFFEDIKSNEQKTITATVNSLETFKIGKFIFDLSAFDWAKDKLSEALLGDSEVIVIDEYGPLEFKGEGLEQIVTNIIIRIKNIEGRKIIIVIREQLLEEFLKKFNLNYNDVEITKIENQSKVLS
jgi:nucleoside-triphosphatase THEP1